MGEQVQIVSKLQEVTIIAVDLDDHAFVPAPGADLSPLLASLRSVGLLNPPWLREKPAGRWQAVAGLKRLRAAALLGWQSVPALTLPAATPDARCLEIALHDNALGRGFCPWEQAFYAVRLMHHWDEAQVVQRFLPLLGLPPSSKILARLLAAASLEEGWQRLLASGRLALTAGARLGTWAPEDRRAVLPFFQVLPFSQSMQEEFLGWLEVLARREGVAITDILSRPELASCLEDPALNPQEKAQRTRRQVRQWVFPRLSAAQSAFEQSLARVGLKQHLRLRLTPPPAFEGPDFHLEIKFRDADELRRLLDELTRISQDKDFFVLTSL